MFLTVLTLFSLSPSPRNECLKVIRGKTSRQRRDVEGVSVLEVRMQDFAFGGW